MAIRDKVETIICRNGAQHRKCSGMMFGLSRKIVAVALVLAPATAHSQEAASQAFCGCMAAQLGMNAVKPVGGKTAYEARALKGLGVALFGGSTVVTMMLQPPSSGDIGDPARYATSCNAVSKGLRCDVTGPAVFEIAVKDQRAVTEIRAGESAVVSMMKNRIRC